MTLLTGASDATAVYVGGTAAAAVYLGAEKVWPLGPTINDYNFYDRFGHGSSEVPVVKAGDVLVNIYMQVHSLGETQSPWAATPGWTMLNSTDFGGLFGGMMEWQIAQGEP